MNDRLNGGAAGMMDLETLVSRIEGGERVEPAELMPYLCAEDKTERGNTNARLAQAYSKSNTQEHLQQAKVFIQRAWLLSGFSCEVLPLYVKICSDSGDVAGIREAYKRSGMQAAARGDISEALRCFNLWHYAYAAHQNLDKYEYDFDILQCVDRLAEPHRFRHGKAPRISGGEKIRIAYLVRGLTEVNSLLVKINLLFAKHHDPSRFEVVFFALHPEGVVAGSQPASHAREAFERFHCRLQCASDDSHGHHNMLLGVAKSIHDFNPHLLAVSAALSDFYHYFIVALRPAPQTVGFLQGPPSQFVVPGLDWSIAWSRHPLMDCPTNCSVIDLELELPGRGGLRAHERSTFDIPENACLLMSCGRFTKFQNRDFWGAVTDILKRHPHAYYVVIGLREEQVPFLKSMLTPDVSARVRFLDWRDDYVNVIGMADVVIDTFPSGGGVVILDAMALGIPVVSFENDYLRLFDQTEWSPAGELVAVSDMIVPRGNFERLRQVVSKLIDDRDYRRRVAEQCRTHVEQANGKPERMVRRCEELYVSVINGAALRRKAAILSHILPPSPSGQAMVLYRLLRGVDPSRYCLLSNANYEPDAYGQAAEGRLPAQYHRLPDPFSTDESGGRGFHTLRKLFQAPLKLIQRTWAIARVVKRGQCGAIVACTADLFNLPAAYFASLLARVPFYAYVFDDYYYQWAERKYRFWARCFEPMVMRGAAGVIVPNEFLRDEYARRYRVEATVVRNPCDPAGATRHSAVPWPASADGIRIVYTGAVYHAHYDAFRNLIAAIGLTGRSDIRLHLYTAQPRTVLEREGITGPVVYHDHVKPSVVSDVQRQADILFLPLAFGSPCPELIRTSAPGKMGEYLAGGRPILVHAPADSYVSTYFTNHRCGVVVDQREPSALAGAIRRIIGDADLRRTLCDNARTRAEVDFALADARNAFLHLLRLADGGLAS